MLSGVHAAVAYLDDVSSMAAEIISGAVSTALAEEVDVLRDKFKYTEHQQLGQTFDIRQDGMDVVYGFSAPHGMRDPRTGRFISWKTLEYGDQGRGATGFLRSAVVNRSDKVGRRITQLITEDLG